MEDLGLSRLDFALFLSLLAPYPQVALLLKFQANFLDVGRRGDVDLADDVFKVVDLFVSQGQLFLVVSDTGLELVVAGEVALGVFDGDSSGASWIWSGRFSS